MFKRNYVVETNTVKKECYLMREDNTMYKFEINIYFSSIGHDRTRQIKATKTQIANCSQ